MASALAGSSRRIRTHRYRSVADRTRTAPPAERSMASASAKSAMWGPNRDGLAQQAGSRGFWPPRGTRLAPKKQALATEYRSNNSPMASTSTTGFRGSRPRALAWDRRWTPRPASLARASTWPHRRTWRGAKRSTAPGRASRSFLCTWNRSGSSPVRVLPAAHTGSFRDSSSMADTFWAASGSGRRARRSYLAFPPTFTRRGWAPRRARRPASSVPMTDRASMPESARAKSGRRARYRRMDRWETRPFTSTVRTPRLRASASQLGHISVSTMTRTSGRTARRARRAAKGASMGAKATGALSPKSSVARANPASVCMVTSTPTRGA